MKYRLDGVGIGMDSDFKANERLHRNHRREERKLQQSKFFRDLLE
jgi:hypothetical protein